MGTVAPRGARAHVLLRAPWADQRLEVQMGYNRLSNAGICFQRWANNNKSAKISSIAATENVDFRLTFQNFLCRN